MRTSNYEKFPAVAVPDGDKDCVTGWDAIAARLRDAIAARSSRRTVMAVECYPGVHDAEVLRELVRRLHPVLALSAAEAMRSPVEVDALVAPFLGGDDPVFGFLSDLQLPAFFAPAKLAELRRRAEQADAGLILIVGCGAHLLHPGDLLVYADLARWEANLRFRRNQTGNLGVKNRTAAASLRYKRAFFVDWRVADRWKRPLIAKWNFVLDTNNPHEPKLATGDGVRRGLRHTVTRPFRVVPYFDPAPWGGHWLQRVCGLDRRAKNYGWGFDCVPEENSLLLDFGNARMEIPSINLVFAQSRPLLGDAVHARFGDEFPIRFDFLDTMGGGNLSFQVHPSAGYAREQFGLSYTQDESYYVLDAEPGAVVYLGRKHGTTLEEMFAALEAAQQRGKLFDDHKFAARFPAKKHDHFLIPAGTLHCSGAGGMVLEISATPYIFTFKLWDWNRLGLDDSPRPVHLAHGRKVIKWERDEDYARARLINQVREVAHGHGWREEHTGLHEAEFIETRRHWFTEVVPHDTRGGVNVLNLVEGEEAIVESPTAAFAPFVIHYAETFIVPAAVSAYTIRPHGNTVGTECATIKAFVRTAT